MSAQAQQQLRRMVLEQRDNFISPDLERVAFDPTYKTDEESVLCIEGFTLQENIREAIDNHNEVPLFGGKDEVAQVKALFHVGSPEQVYFQCWRHFEVLSRKKIWLFLDGDSFDLEERAPLVIDSRLDAVYWEGDLLFRSYGNANSMLDMLDYVSEATEQDIKSFAKLSIFGGSASELGKHCSNLHRRQIRALVQDGGLDSLTVDKLKAQAEGNAYKLQLKSGKVVMPTGGKALSELLSFLQDRVYLGPVTGRPLLANSARNRNSRRSD
jgi:hypothetical protein